MLRDAWEIHKVKFATYRAIPELKQTETNRKNHLNPNYSINPGLAKVKYEGYTCNHLLVCGLCC